MADKQALTRSEELGSLVCGPALRAGALRLVAQAMRSFMAVQTKCMSRAWAMPHKLDAYWRGQSITQWTLGTAPMSCAGHLRCPQVFQAGKWVVAQMLNNMRPCLKRLPPSLLLAVGFCSLFRTGALTAKGIFPMLHA